MRNKVTNIMVTSGTNIALGTGSYRMLRRPCSVQVWKCSWPTILTRQCVVLQPLLRRVMLEYGSREAASYALDKLHGFEYPPGKKIVVKTEYEQRGDG